MNWMSFLLGLLVGYYFINTLQHLGVKLFFHWLKKQVETPKSTAAKKFRQKLYEMFSEEEETGNN